MLFMKCHACKVDNPNDAKYCRMCGKKLLQNNLFKKYGTALSFLVGFVGIMIVLTLYILGVIPKFIVNILGVFFSIFMFIPMIIWIVQDYTDFQKK